jgi:hypothetical protein
MSDNPTDDYKSLYDALAVRSTPEQLQAVRLLVEHAHDISAGNADVFEAIFGSMLKACEILQNLGRGNTFAPPVQPAERAEFAPLIAFIERKRGARVDRQMWTPFFDELAADNLLGEFEEFYEFCEMQQWIENVLPPAMRIMKQNWIDREKIARTQKQQNGKNTISRKSDAAAIERSADFYKDRLNGAD